MRRFGLRGWCVLAVCLAAAAPLPARAWGKMGHEIVAELASRELSEAARAEQRKLLGTSLSSVANWADEIRRQRRNTSSWHYVNIPLEAPGYDRARDCSQRECIVTALEHQLEILRDRGRSREARAEALRFVVHLVGDLHQPLHCADRGDRGGNDVKLRWFSRKANLHEVWDAGILSEPQLSRPQQVARLAKKMRAVDREALQRGSPAEWATEAHGLAAVAYDLPESGALADAYYRRAAPVVDQQLIRAGLRLARLLNEALAEAPSRGFVDPGPVPPSPDLDALSGSCVPRESCCKVCSKGQACGDSCIRATYICHKGDGCACDAAEVCR